MAQFQSSASPTVPQPGQEVVAQADVASPAPLGLSILAFTTAIFGCYYTGFIVPYEAASIRPALSAMLLIGGIIMVLERRSSNGDDRR